MRFSNSTVIAAQAASTSKTSAVLDASCVFSCSFQIISTDNTNAGALQVQFSNDPVQGLAVSADGKLIPVNWSNLGTAATVAAGAINSVQIPQSSYAGYRWLRAVWTPSAGAGTITVNAVTLGA